MPNQGAMMGMFCVIITLGLLLGLLVSAVILRAAVALFNKLAGQSGGSSGPEYYPPPPPVDDGSFTALGYPANPYQAGRYSQGYPSHSGKIPDPSFGKAMGIAAVMLIVNFLVGLVLGFVVYAATGQQGGMGGFNNPGGPASTWADIVANLISLPVTLFVDAAILAGMLPTSYGRGVLVMLLDYAITIVVVIVIVVFVIGAMMLAGVAMR